MKAAIIPAEQAGIIQALEDASERKLRFDTGFVGFLPVLASGKIGRRYFYFRFRYDTATLKVGSPDTRWNHGYAKKRAYKIRRRLRRGHLAGYNARIAAEQLSRRARRSADTFPARAVISASIGNVTGEPYCGILSPEKAASLFTELLGQQKPDRRRRLTRKMKQIIRGSYTPPMSHSNGAICKPSKRRR